MQIENIMPIGKKKERYHVVLSSGQKIVLHGMTIIKSKLKVGDEISQERLEEYQFEYEKLTAFDKAVDYLSRGMKTKKQMEQYLISKGYLPLTREYVLHKLIEYRYLDDSEYAKSFVKYASSGKGQKMIKFELRQKGVEESVINESLELIENEEEAAMRVAVKYVRGKRIDENFKARLYRYLVGRGFSYEIVSSVVKRVLQEENNLN